MTRDETRSEIDLSLSIEGIKQRDTNLLGVGGQVIERLAAIARNVGWRYIEIASKVKRHRSVQNATHRLNVVIPVGCPNFAAKRHQPQRHYRSPRTATNWPTRQMPAV